MKPRIFIGSSSERLEIAYAIQSELDHDADTTVWTQGVFKLSQNSLDSLIATVDHSDFAIFVFYPDDATQIRDKKVFTVRDNLIFELGLFMGKLGKERVFFLRPRSIQQLHLPTDLLGVTAGTYDDSRSDGNIQASIGTFCTQVRESLKGFVLQNIEDVHNESDTIKKIVLEKPTGWQNLFVSALIRDRMVSINKAYSELESNLYAQRAIVLDGNEFFEWYRKSVNSFQHLIPLFGNIIEEITTSFGPIGVPSKTIEMKNAVERVINFCKEVLSWEYELSAIYPPEELLPAKELMKGATKMFINEVNKMPNITEEAVRKLVSGESKEDTLVISLVFPEKVTQALGYFEKYLKEQALKK